MDWKVTTPPASEPISLTEAKLHLRVDHSSDDTLITALMKAAREFAEDYQNRSYVAQVITAKLDDLVADEIELPRSPLISVTSIKYYDTDGVEQTVSTDVYGYDTTADPGKIYLKYNQTWPACRGHHGDVTIVYTAGYACPFTANATTDVITAVGREFTDGDSFRLSTTDADLPGGLAVDTLYYAVSSSGSTCKLAASAGGSAINITDAGTGTHFIDMIPERVRAAIKLLIGHLYEHRESASEIKVDEIPMGVKALLGIDRIGIV